MGVGQPRGLGVQPTAHLSAVVSPTTPAPMTAMRGALPFGLLCSAGPCAPLKLRRIVSSRTGDQDAAPLLLALLHLHRRPLGCRVLP